MNPATKNGANTDSKPDLFESDESTVRVNRDAESRGQAELHQASNGRQRLEIDCRFTPGEGQGIGIEQLAAIQEVHSTIAD